MKERGATLLIGVMIMGAVASTIAVTIVLIGISNTQNQIVNTHRVQASVAGNSCGEIVLQMIYDDNSYSGSGIESIGDSTCEYLVIDHGGEDREIQITATVGSVVRKEQIQIDTLSPQINIASWNVVADF